MKKTNIRHFRELRNLQQFIKIIAEPLLIGKSAEFYFIILPIYNLGLEPRDYSYAEPCT